jgi:hypothetical protein
VIALRALPWLLFFAFTLPAVAQKAERPEVRPGDRWQFVVYYATPATQPNREWLITEVTTTAISGTENGEPLALTPELNVLASPRHTDSNPQALKFPLEVGKRWRYSGTSVLKVKNSTSQSVVDVVVVAREEVSVPAGKFDAFKLTAKGTLSGTAPIGSTYDGTQTNTTYWYAPSARAIVKSIHHNPYLGTSTVELVSAELRP